MNNNRAQSVAVKLLTNNRKCENGRSQTSGSRATSMYTSRRSTATPPTSHNVDCIINKPELSQDFLRCLNTLTKQDFEHTNDVNGNPRGRELLDVNTYFPPPAHRSRKPASDGFKFFVPSPPATTQSYSRPLSAPRISRQSEYDSMNSRNILRPASASSPKARALIKSKVLPPSSNDFTACPVTVAPVERKRGRVSRNRPVTATATCASTSTENSFYYSSESERPNTVSSSPKRVTFAADVINYDRESKPPKRRKLPKRRRQGFPHRSRGIFVPPEQEIVDSAGPSGMCVHNPYLNYNQVWTHPSARNSEESCEGQLIRQERFHKLMDDLERAHIHYNRVADSNQNEYLLQSIFKRYILVLDLALTEGQFHQIEHLLDTILKSVPVLQQNTFLFKYGPDSPIDNGNGPVNKRYTDILFETRPDLLLADYALTKISGNRSKVDYTDMSIETVLVKLCLEIIVVVYAPFGSLLCRNTLAILPSTVKRALALLTEMQKGNDSYAYIKWINNSAVQRDFRSILKNVGLLDNYGSKAEFPEPLVKTRVTTAASCNGGKVKSSS